VILGTIVPANLLGFTPITDHRMAAPAIMPEDGRTISAEARTPEQYREDSWLAQSNEDLEGCNGCEQQ
jgi:hypothetical protein